jgi:multidrug resistance efflux pump
VVRGKTVVARLSTADAPLLDPRMRGELSAAVEAARAAVGQARAEFDRATAELMRARTTLQRQQELMKAGAIAADNLDAAETAVATADEARAAEFAASRSEYELRGRACKPAPAGRAVRSSRRSTAYLKRLAKRRSARR